VTGKKNVLIIGLDLALIDFSKPGYPPGMTAEKVLAGIKLFSGGKERMEDECRPKWQARPMKQHCNRGRPLRGGDDA